MIRANFKIGQFSESPVLAMARALGLDDKYSVQWSTERVPSSPSQFQSLADGAIDLAITSPDNVLLYATTAANPIKMKLPVKFLRTIDRGLGLALYTAPKVVEITELRKSKLGVDVPNSGFAFLLFAMAKKLGIEREEYDLESLGATPKRLTGLLEGDVTATILNAETAIRAEEAGATKWATSLDISPDYLGTVLVDLDSPGRQDTGPFLDMWDEATDVILASDSSKLVNLLETDYKNLANPEYVALLQSKDFGLLQDREVSPSQLAVLTGIRSEFGAYTPSEESLSELLGD